MLLLDAIRSPFGTNRKGSTTRLRREAAHCRGKPNAQPLSG
jgi:hypothetical protein